MIFTSISRRIPAEEPGTQQTLPGVCGWPDTPSWACVACSSSLGASPVCGSHACLRCLGCPRSRPSPWGSGIQCDPRVTVISCPGRDGAVTPSRAHGPPAPPLPLLATEPSLPPDLQTPTCGEEADYATPGAPVICPPLPWLTPPPENKC